MTHSIDFDSIEARLFALHHVALGSKAFCDRLKISRDPHSTEDYEWHEYVGQLKALVSATMIDAAIKVRMLQDFAKVEDQDLDIEDLQMQALAGLKIGDLNVIGQGLSIRESCNKVIHATSSNHVWESVEGMDRSFEYWTGVCRFNGCSQSGREWTASIIVPDWCTAMRRFLIGFQHTVDWSRALKWAE